MESKFESAKLYLIELLRIYGHRPIIVKIKQDGEEVEVMARTFVRRQLTAAEIEFPWNELNKRSPKIKNPELDDDELSLLFHRAVFELETAYVEEFCQGKPDAEAYINSVTEEDVKALKKIGFKKISSVRAMMQVFWSFASHRIPISNSMKNAILSITVDEEAGDYLESYCHFYNSFIQGKIESNAWPVDEEQVKKYEKQIKELNRKHQVELEEQNKKHKKEITERNKKHQEEQHELAKKSKAKVKECNALIEKIRRLVINPNGKINQTYDLTDEHDIRAFISWFKTAHKKVKNQTVKYIVAKRFEDNPDDAELFKKMVDDVTTAMSRASVSFGLI